VTLALFLPTSLVFGNGCTSLSESSAELGTGEFPLTAPFDVKGDLGTEFGDGSNNRCSFGLPAALDLLPAAPSGKIRYRSMGGEVLPPSAARLAHFGDWDSHVQSMVRLSLPWDGNIWAAVSRSNPGSPGGSGVFLVGLDGVDGGSGTRWVLPGRSFTGNPPSPRRTYLYYPIGDTDHAGGMQAVGDALIVASEGLEGQAPFVDFLRRTPNEVGYEPLSRFILHGDLGETVVPTRFITAAAMARLGTGRYLLFVLGKDEDQQGWFYLSDQTILDASTTWSFLDHVELPWPYQNAALLTECDSADIYLVATSNPDFNGEPDSGTEYADVLRVDWNPSSERVEVPLLAFRAFDAGGGGYCTFRASATPYVDSDGRLLLYCHAYKANTDIFGEPDSKLKLVEYSPP
jgi:hypothetical protein